MGQCYEKLGSAEARQAYERAVATSPTRSPWWLSLKPGCWHSADSDGHGVPASLTGPKSTTRPGFADGRYLSCVDWDTGDLALHDFATGSDRSPDQ